jgi:formate hydrogenlyase transcriptional activator
MLGTSGETTNEATSIKQVRTNDELPLEEEPGGRLNFEGIVGKSRALKQTLRLVETVAPTDSTVLLLGETGTGKELIARAIHERSRRKGRGMVKVNCAAIPSGLLESELFGHERGAFTGAITQKVGRVELADQGTLFLDEIGDIPLELQPKLLRVLQEREFERLGSTRTIKVDVRLVAATHRDLEEMVSDRQFRGDLYYRLNVFPIKVSPLRERAEDIPLLVSHFVQHFARRMGRVIETIPTKTMDILVEYAWPGNIRELQNLIERAVILSRGRVLEVPLERLSSRTIRVQGEGKHQTLEHAEREFILATLKDTKWVLSGPKGAATRLGLNRSTLYFRMKKLGIPGRRDVFEAMAQARMRDHERSVPPRLATLRRAAGCA